MTKAKSAEPVLCPHCGMELFGYWKGMAPHVLGNMLRANNLDSTSTADIQKELIRAMGGPKAVANYAVKILRSKKVKVDVKARLFDMLISVSKFVDDKQGSRIDMGNATDEQILDMLSVVNAKIAKTVTEMPTKEERTETFRGKSNAPEPPQEEEAESEEEEEEEGDEPDDDSEADMPPFDDDDGDDWNG